MAIEFESDMGEVLLRLVCALGYWLESVRALLAFRRYSSTDLHDWNPCRWNRGDIVRAIQQVRLSGRCGRVDRELMSIVAEGMRPDCHLDNTVKVELKEQDREHPLADLTLKGQVP
jgi:hypothetical protein